MGVSQVYFLATFLICCICIIGTFPDKAQADTRMEIHAIVLPTVTIHVNKYFVIQEISSNTHNNQNPTFVIVDENNKQITFLPFIKKQYNFLKPKLNFTHIGVLYTTEEQKTRNTFTGKIKEKTITFFSKILNQNHAL